MAHAHLKSNILFRIGLYLLHGMKHEEWNRHRNMKHFISTGFVILAITL